MDGLRASKLTANWHFSVNYPFNTYRHIHCKKISNNPAKHNSFHNGAQTCSEQFLPLAVSWDLWMCKSFASHIFALWHMKTPLFVRWHENHTSYAALNALNDVSSRPMGQSRCQGTKINATIGTLNMDIPLKSISIWARLQTIKKLNVWKKKRKSPLPFSEHTSNRLN